MKKITRISVNRNKRLRLSEEKSKRNPGSYRLMLWIICFLMCSDFVSAQLTRQQIIDNAEPYTSFSWTASECNLWSGVVCNGKKVYSADIPWVNVGTNISMPYCWGGWSTQEQHITAMANCKSAGDICSATGGGCSGSGAGLSCASGHDCSGLVSRAWGLTSKRSTATLPEISSSIPLSQVQPGDIVNIAGSHVRLVETNYGNGNYQVIEASGKDWKTAYHTYTAVQLATYDPRCPNSTVLQGGCGITPPPNDNCSGAVVLTTSADCNPTSGNIAGATQSLAPITCGGYTSTLCNDVWYRFTATSTDHVISLYPSTGLDAVVDLRSGSCNGTNIACSDNGGGHGGAEIINATGLTVGSDYFIRIYDYTSSSTPPSTTVFEICVTTGCGLPGSVTVSGSGTFCSGAILTASGGNGGTIYWQGTTDNGTSTSTPSNSQTVTSSGTYYFRAYNSCGWGIQGSAAVTILGVPATQAGALAFSGVGTNSMTAGWTNGNGSRRVVFISTTSGFAAPENGTDPSSNPVYGGSVQQCIYNGTGSSVTVTGLAAGTTYWFRVYEANCTGTSSLYNITTGPNNPASQATTAACTPPVSPTSATATPSTINSGQQTTLQVNGGALNSAPYWIWYTGNCGSTMAGSGPSLIVTPLITTTYYVQASACGTSTTCRSVTVKVIPPAPVATSAGNITQTGFSANWNASPGVTGYYIDVATNQTFSSFVKNYKNKKIGNVTTLSVSGLTAGTAYYYRLRAYNTTGTSPNSNTIGLTTLAKTTMVTQTNSDSDITTAGSSGSQNSATTGIGYNLDHPGNGIFEVRMYPNPTKGPVTFEVGKNFENVAVSVFSLYGTEVFHKEYHAPERISFDLSQHPAGMYVVKIISGETEIVKKLVLDR